MKTLKHFTITNLTQTAPRVGLIILQTDETAEYELSRYLAADNATILHARIPCAPNVTPETLIQMKSQLQTTIALFPENLKLNCIAYACTSASLVIGEQAITDQLTANNRAHTATNPLTAIKSALHHLSARNIAYIAPYQEALSLKMCEALTTDTTKVITAGSFHEENDATVARISENDLRTATLSLIANTKEKVDAIILSCTSLATLNLIPSLEAELQIPVISSNLALAWHIKELAQLKANTPHPTKLLS